MRKFVLAILLLAGLMQANPTPAEAQTSLKAVCQRAGDPAANEIQCDVRATDPVALSDLSATLAGGRRLEAKYEPFNHRVSSSSWLFLLQRTSHPKDAAREVERLLRPEGKRTYGIVAFSDTIEELAPLGASAGALKEGLEAIGSRTNAKTGLFASAYDAILKLAAHSADRRALVILADGRSDRDSRDASSVIELANQRNIVIHTFALTDRESGGNENREVLRRLATETGGRFVDAGTERKLSADTVATFTDVMENGGLLKLKATDLPNNEDLVLTASIAQGATLSVSKGAIKWGPLSPVREVSPVEKVTDWAKQNPLILLAAGLVAIGGLGFMMAMSRVFAKPAPVQPINIYNAMPEGSRTQKPGQHGAETVIMAGPNRPSPDRVYAWLQFLDANSTRMPIGTTSVRIGRHEDNDICLANQSVHRQHAVIHMTSDGQFDVRDLGGQNGVVLNGKRVQQSRVADGDLLEFGEVRARFVISTEA